MKVKAAAETPVPLQMGLFDFGAAPGGKTTHEPAVRAEPLPTPRPSAEPVQALRPMPDQAPVRTPVETRTLAPAPRSAGSGTVFVHPRAEREILLGEHRIGYAFRRSRRHSIGFVIGTDGLTVSAPRWVAWKDVDAALRAKADWVVRKLHDQRERARRVEATRIEWRDGTHLPFLGENIIIVLDPRAAGAVLHTSTQALPGVAQMTLHVGLPQTADAEQIRDVVQSWLQREALRIFGERCQCFAARLGVRVKRLSLSSAQTRWGSASADGSVRLNWRLVHFTLPVIDYVVAHELAHLREMNHSPAFWEVVRSVLPEFEQLRGQLKDETLPALS
jgi:predicted metal-dependent hydrolase